MYGQAGADPANRKWASLERLAWQEQDFAIIGISTDDYADKAASLLKGTNATISHFIDHDLQMENMLGASHLPLTVFVDADGRILQKIYGARQWMAPIRYGSSTTPFTRLSDLDENPWVRRAVDVMRLRMRLRRARAPDTRGHLFLQRVALRELRRPARRPTR